MRLLIILANAALVLLVGIYIGMARHDARSWWLVLGAVVAVGCFWLYHVAVRRDQFRAGFEAAQELHRVSRHIDVRA